MQRFYTVKKGDTLYQIAARWELSVQMLIAANNLRPPYIIKVGEQLSIPPGVEIIRVNHDDTIQQLSHYFGIPMSVIIKNNNLNQPYELEYGQLLKIPAGVPFYITAKNDDLYTIAKKFNIIIGGRINPEPIRLVNHLFSYHLPQGIKLKIPYTIPYTSGAIAYNSIKNGHYDLSLFDMESGRDYCLTSQLAASYTIPKWSKDNSMLAFVGKDEKLYIYFLKQGKTTLIDQLIKQTNYYVDWSNDNNKLAYVKGNQIVIYHLQTTTKTEIDHQGISALSWLPSNKELLYAGIDENGVGQLYKASIDDSTKYQLTNNLKYNLTQIHLSQNGNIVVYKKDAKVTQLYITHITTGETTEIDGGPLGKNHYPICSTSPFKIAYCSTEYEGNGRFSFLRITDEQNKNGQIIAVSDSEETPLTWSPDERKIAYLSGYKGDKHASEIWIVDIKHPAPIKLTGGQNITAVQWSNPTVTTNKVEKMKGNELIIKDEQH